MLRKHTRTYKYVINYFLVKKIFDGATLPHSTKNTIWNEVFTHRCYLFFAFRFQFHYCPHPQGMYAGYYKIRSEKFLFDEKSRRTLFVLAFVLLSILSFCHFVVTITVVIVDECAKHTYMYNSQTVQKGNSIFQMYINKIKEFLCRFHHAEKICTYVCLYVRVMCTKKPKKTKKIPLKSIWEIEVVLYTMNRRWRQRWTQYSAHSTLCNQFFFR